MSASVGLQYVIRIHADHRMLTAKMPLPALRYRDFVPACIHSQKQARQQVKFSFKSALIQYYLKFKTHLQTTKAGKVIFEISQRQN